VANLKLLLWIFPEEGEAKSQGTCQESQCPCRDSNRTSLEYNYHWGQVSRCILCSRYLKQLCTRKNNVPFPYWKAHCTLVLNAVWSLCLSQKLFCMNSNDVCIFGCAVPYNVIIGLLYSDQNKFICTVMARALSQWRLVYNNTSIKCIVLLLLYVMRYDLFHGPTVRFGRSTSPTKCTFIP
jgi:hypothetical protein